MRFREHFGIAKDVAGEKAGFFYLTGSLFPDYVERHRIHRSDETLGLIKKRIYRIQHTSNPLVKDYLLGTVMHYMCDYCCYSHGDKYYEMIHHRKFENAEQDYFCKHSRKKYLINAEAFYRKNRDKNKKLSIEKTLKRRENYIENLNSTHWWSDERIMKADLYYAYALCYYIYRTV